MIDLQHLQQFLPQNKFELVSDTISVAALGSPVWLPWLKEMSEIAALWLPILGAVWLLTQIGLRWYQHFRGKG